MVVKDIYYVYPVRVFPFDADATEVEATSSISDEESLKISATLTNMLHKP